jgi:hypothetical protein
MKVAKEKVIKNHSFEFFFLKIQKLGKIFFKKWSKCKSIFCKEILWKLDFH